MDEHVLDLGLVKDPRIYAAASVSGSTASFTAEAEGLPLKSVLVNIEPVQSGSGDPSPSNVRPISGWTGVNLYREAAYDSGAAPFLSVSFPEAAGTVYGGTLNLTTGLMTVTHARVDLGTLTWTVLNDPAVPQGAKLFNTRLTGRKYGTQAEGVTGVCDSYQFFGNGAKNTILSSLGNGQFAFRYTTDTVIIRNDACADETALTSALNGVYLVYPLLEPVLYKLTPRDAITTLFGTNCIWADTGDIGVSYGDWLSTIYRAVEKRPLEGLRLSLLGDSMSTYAGYIPAGNATYYTGRNAGVSSVDQIWWKRLCDETGMVPLVIDAWSGSSIAYNYSTREDHSDQTVIPMSSDLRTQRLKVVDGSDEILPDIIILAGGTNDWTYAQETTTPLWDEEIWDGRTHIDRQRVLNGTSSFAESYASILEELRKNYPKAIVVGVSCWFCCRRHNNEAGLPRLNDVGYTESDYSDTIEKVCKIMGVPYIDVYNVGFNEYNYRPAYAQDHLIDPAHMNSTGHEVIAKRFVEELPRLVGQYIRPREG